MKELNNNSGGCCSPSHEPDVFLNAMMAQLEITLAMMGSLKPNDERFNYCMEMLELCSKYYEEE